MRAVLVVLLSATAAFAAQAGLRRSVAASGSGFLAELYSGDATCNAGPGAPVTRLLAESGLCQRESDHSSFAVRCAADGRSGTVAGCADAACSVGCVQQPFVSGACAAHTSPPAIGLGAARSSRISCVGVGNLLTPSLGCGRCSLEYDL